MDKASSYLINIFRMESSCLTKVKAFNSSRANVMKVTLEIPTIDDALVERDALRVKNKEQQKTISALLSQAIEKETEVLDLQAQLEEAQREARKARDENNLLKTRLERMMLKLRNEKRCPQCAKTFKSKSGLLSHMNVHTSGIR